MALRRIRADRAIEAALGLVLVLMVLLNFANVVGRYGFGESLYGADEIQLFALVVVAYLGAVAVTLRADHLRMDVVAKLFPARLRRAVLALEWLVFAATCGFVAYHSFLYANRMRVLGRVSDMAELPVWTVHGTVTLAFAAMALIATARLWRVLRGSADVPPPAQAEALPPAARGTAREAAS